MKQADIPPKLFNFQFLSTQSETSVMRAAHADLVRQLRSQRVQGRPLPMRSTRYFRDNRHFHRQ